MDERQFVRIERGKTDYLRILSYIIKIQMDLN